ncbi:MAG: hypothetical protein ACO1NM_08065 [Sphingobium phenoxybenzoativorans]|uniref:hypothetical protein n=1 Tax=Sphingobium phenoxybenzoativorans TaxID=1592790 RepID=UPI00087278B5|nr:hypothetical protein [Sphingobium phenoxybenzoativorans]
MSESKPRRLTEKLPFLGALWLAIATALLCAIVPSGLPGSESRGSAFNPSNSVVALRAKSTKAVPAVEKIADKDSIKPASHGGWRSWHDLAIASANAVQAIAIATLSPAFTSQSDQIAPTGLFAVILPRGPPAAG